MIFFGSYGRRNVLGSVGIYECDHCERPSPFVTTENYRKGHIFWIPLFSYGKKHFVHCAVCERGTDVSEADAYAMLRGESH